MSDFVESRYASRKFVLAAASLFMAWIAFPLDLISADQVLDFSMWVLGIYMAGNVSDQTVTK